MNTFWKIYFWVFSFFAGLSYIGEVIVLFHNHAQTLPLMLVDLVISLPAYIILYAFVFRKEVFTFFYRKLISIIFICWEIAANTYIYPHVYGTLLVATIFGMIFYLPEYFAILRYSFYPSRMETVPETTIENKKAISGYVFGGLSFIPLFGIIFGIIAIVIGATKKVKGPIYLGSAGIFLTILMYGSLFYFGTVAKTGPFADLRAQMMPNLLNTDAGQITLYKQKNGKLPEKLSDIPSDQNNFFVPTDAWGTDISYKPNKDGSFELRSAGPDKILNTSDDIAVTY